MPVKKFSERLRARKRNLKFLPVLAFAWLVAGLYAHAEAHNPVIHADVPNLAMIRVGDTYYMSSTTLARSYYSLDGKSWTPIGGTLKMTYSLAHFVGYRFGLFNYATKTPGGFADLDFFRISEKNQNEN